MRELFRRKPSEPVNPDGLAFTQFIEKYKEYKHIAFLCWEIGCYPEELKQELKKLLESKGGN